MRAIIFTTSCWLLYTFCLCTVQAQNGVSIIKGSIPNEYDGKIFLSKMEKTEKGVKHKMIDSAVCHKGSFIINIKEIERPDIYQLYAADRGYYTELALSKGAVIQVELKKYDPYNTVVKTESSEQKVMDIVRGAVRNGLKEIVALNDEEHIQKKKISENEYDRLFNLYGQKAASVIKQYPQHIAAFMALSEAIFLKEKQYMDLYESLDTTAFQYAYYFQRAKEKYLKAKDKWLVGTYAKPFTATDSNGVPFSLAQWKGKYILLDFWASWCIPCRKKNKTILNAFPELKKKKIEIVSFSFDDKKSLWDKASSVDKIAWVNVSDLVGFQNSPVIQAYKIETLPSVFLIDPDGKIIAQNISIKDVLQLQLK